MTSNLILSGHRVLVPGGTGGVGEGVVRQYLAAGAEVVVPTRTPERAAEFRRVLGPAATSHLHLVVHDYTTFAGAEDLAAQTEHRLGGIDDVIAPIGGFWAGRPLWEVTEADWQGTFVQLATAHLAVLRACLPQQTFDAVEAGQIEVLADDRTREVKASLPCGHELLYPPLEQFWDAAVAARG
jgi:3-oxoacyl-[acyl-carrier protein] reductase